MILTLSLPIQSFHLVLAPGRNVVALQPLGDRVRSHGKCMSMLVCVISLAPFQINAGSLAMFCYYRFQFLHLINNQHLPSCSMGKTMRDRERDI